MLRYRVIGLMSGTSLDGLDIAYCEFTYKSGKWGYTMGAAETIPYGGDMLNALKTAYTIPANELLQLHNEYGKYLGSAVKKFIKKHKLKDVDFVSSHGHTIFHQPDKGYTFQLGAGSSLAAAVGLPVVSDFRSGDVALGGQGAPLVPIGDELLFADYAQCLNLGGFANVSYKQRAKRIAFDIAPVNIVLNALVAERGKNYDDEGQMARLGKVHEALLVELNALDFFSKIHPKSLGREWLEEEYLPLLNKHSISLEDKLRTVCENVAQQIGKALNGGPKGKVLITGGGAFNIFMIELITQKTDGVCVIPDRNLVEYKEALVFAFLGVLRMRNEVNCLSSVTGASRDSVGGVVCYHS